jgi:adenylate cyclase
MFTDMVGYTAATQANERAALSLLKEEENLVRPALTAHQGREVKSSGDGFLVEFRSSLEATDCAVDIQRLLHEHNARPGTAPIKVRIGIHLGDVEKRGSDIFGDAVNIAARLESFAEPGGICLSGAVYEQVRNKIPYKLEKLSPTTLKGVQLPVQLYRVVLPWNVPEHPSATSGPARLAVLPFANISPDPNDAYFADGLTDELITVLSQIRELRVIARTSVTPYKSATKGVVQIGAELGVDAILEGTVRKFGDELRITVQLIDVGTQAHTWAASYDRRLDKVFVVQSEIAKQVAEALEVRLKPTDEDRLASRPSIRPESYLAYLKGRTLLHDRSETALREAKKSFERAVALDGTNAAALSGLSDVTRLIGSRRRDSPLEEWDQASRSLAERAVALDPNLAEAHTSLGYSLWSDYDYARAETEFRLAISLSPSYAPAHQWYADLLGDENRIDESLAESDLAEQADPLSSVVLANHASRLVFLGRFEEAQARIDRLERIEGRGLLFTLVSVEFWLHRSDYPRTLSELSRLDELNPGDPENLALKGTCYARMGQNQRARDCLKELEGMSPGRRPDSGIAEIYACLGELDPCFLWLERSAFESYDLDAAYWRGSPLFEQVRRDPRFQALLKKMNLA